LLKWPDMTVRWTQSVVIGVGMLLAVWVTAGDDTASRIVGATGALFLPLALWSAWTRRPVVDDRWDLLAFSPMWLPMIAGAAVRVWHLPITAGFFAAMAIMALALGIYVVRQVRRRST
jgi:hypothetical protein